ncbi:MAG: hypothetical protein RLZZ385_1509 [Pseudomonadota bacterium]|jgi:hypothetical protein
MAGSPLRPFIRYLLTGVLLLSTPLALASDWEMSRLAGQLEQASGRFADELRYQRGYGTLSHQARQLSLKAGQLRDSLARQRSAAYLSAQFNDVQRQYLRLESAVLVAGGGRGGLVGLGFDSIALLYGDLVAVRQSIYLDPGYATAYRYPSRPRVYVAPPPQVYFFERNDRGRRDDWDHRSPVQERRYRREAEEHRDSIRRDTETRRDNHYEDSRGNNGSYRLGRP